MARQVVRQDRPGGVAKTGENTLVLNASPFNIAHELEAAYIIGDFAIEPAERGFTITRKSP